MLKKIIIFILILLLPVSLAFGNTNSEADKLFYEGKKLYKQQRYNEAIKKFSRAIKIEEKLGSSRKPDLGGNISSRA